jgi:hypothetical protein
MQGTPAPATAGNNAQHDAWYECESIAYSNFGMIRKLTDHDWNSFTGNMMCLVSADAYATAYGIFTPLDASEQTALGHRMTTGQLHAADGRTVHVSATPNKCMTTTHQQCIDTQRALLTTLTNTQHQDDDMQVDSPPSSPQQPRVFWCNPLAQAEAMELSSDDDTDEEMEPEQTLTAAMQIDRTQTEDAVDIWVDPASVGLYCEPQVDWHCLCHAWHALLDRRVARRYFYHRLITSNAPRHELARFGPHGNYHPGALNLYALEHSTDNRHVTLMDFADCRLQRFTKEQILEKAPADCKGIIAHFALSPPADHYSAWRQATDGHWYDCDSITYECAGKVKRMHNKDWEAFEGTLYCLVELDPLP